MNEKEIEALADEITKRIFAKIEEDAKLLDNPPEDWMDIMITDEQKIKELELLIHFYETNEDYIKAANAFKTLKDLEKNISP